MHQAGLDLLRFGDERFGLLDGLVDRLKNISDAMLLLWERGEPKRQAREMLRGDVEHRAALAHLRLVAVCSNAIDRIPNKAGNKPRPWSEYDCVAARICFA
ncbi:MAG: hypothetical protein CO108_24025 [Deltaproteobacteria bacterium CG_4_9_14_3_um_filter_63_12]|nr:MAG: hypothetical protein CO108_24025 [Deltaproteobacteria bacterium CG_4_9_14_3_um_filter_63_12]